MDTELDWMVARHGIKLLLNDKNKEAEDLFNNSPQNMHMTAGLCYVTFLNALMSFDDKKVAEAILKIKKIEEECVSQIGWIKSIKNKLFYSPAENKMLEQVLEERIILADSLVCQSFLTFLRNDFTSYMKGGWTLRKAWKIYQNTYDQLSMLHIKFCGQNVAGIPNSETKQPPVVNSASSSWSVGIDEESSILSNNCTNTNKAFKYNHSEHVCKNTSDTIPSNFYSCSSSTISDFSNFKTKNDEETDCKKDEIILDSIKKTSDNNLTNSSTHRLSVQSDYIRPTNLHNTSFSSDETLNRNTKNSIRKSVSLFSSINSFGSAIYESATSLIGFKKEYINDWEKIEPESVLRLMSAVCFGYGVFRLCVSLAPSYILKWINMLGFEGDQSIAIESLHFSRNGNDMRSPLASLTLLWYHTVVCPFFNADGKTIELSIAEASKILHEEKEFQNSSLFLFFQGRVERIKPNIAGAIEAYELSIANASLTDVKLLGLHEVGWCHLLTLDYQKAFESFLQLRHKSKWSKSFYAYMTTINAGACGNTKYVLLGKNEVRALLEKSHNKGAQIEKYIRRRMEKLPEKENYNSEWVKDKTYWKLYCFEMLYLWNTFPSCSTSVLNSIVETCTPMDEEKCLTHEPMIGIGWLIKGAVLLILGNRMKYNGSNGNIKHSQESSCEHLTNAIHAFRMCLNIRSSCTDDIHISAFAQYELALLLLRNECTRPEGKLLLLRSQSQYKDFDFEHRLNVRINNTLKSVEKYELERCEN